MEPENSLRTLADRLPSGILFQLVRPPDGAIRLNQISAGVARLTGVSVAEALRDRETLLGLLVPDDRAAYLRAEAESLRTMTVLDTVVRSQSPHGEVCWWQVRAAPRSLPDGSLALDGLAIDVTGPHESQERYRSLIEDQTEVVCRLLPNGTFVFVNDVYCRFFGRSREELLSGAWQPLAYSRDVPHVEAKVRQLTPANPVVRLENRVFDANHQLRWMEFVNRGFFGPDGVLREIQAVGRDITERKWAQLQLEVENRIAVVVAEAESLDAAGGLILPLLCAALEMEAGEFWQLEATSGLLGRTHAWAEAGSPAGAFLRVTEKRTFAHGVGLPGATLAAGRAVWLTDLAATPTFLRQTEATAAGFRSGLGLPVRTGVVVLFATTAVPWDARAFTAFADTLGRQLTRILDKKQAEEDLRRTLHQREVLLKEVHHRVKNNLQVITSLLRLQARLSDAGPARAVLRESQNRVRAIALVHENLYRAGDLEHVNSLDYFRPLAAALASTHGAETRRIELTLDVEPIPLALDQTVPCGLIVNELIANSFKHAFTDRRQGTIRLELRAESGVAELSVTDDGVGLPAAVELLGDRSLGFQLVRELAAQLAGAVTFSSMGGTRVVVRFPLRAPGGERACP